MLNFCLPHHRQILHRLRSFEIIILSLFFVGLAWASFDFGPDPFVDSGRELWVPLALNSGKVLYRDISYFNGPLAPYLNALFFRFLPFGIVTWKVLNLIWTCGIFVCVWWILKKL
jgi:hypothetical protein